MFSPIEAALTTQTCSRGLAWGGALLALCLVGACSHTPFTKTIRDRHQLTDDHLSHIQFYNSGEIVLQRQLPVQKREVVDSELEIRDEMQIERVVIKRGTPGVAVRIEGQHLLVSFTRGMPERSLWFSLKEETDQYTLSHLTAGLKSDPFKEEYSPGFQVRYGGKEYAVVDDDTWKVHLAYDQAHTFDDSEDVEKPKGWSLKP